MLSQSYFARYKKSIGATRAEMPKLTYFSHKLFSHTKFMEKLYEYLLCKYYFLKAVVFYAIAAKIIVIRTSDAFLISPRKPPIFIC